MRIAIVSDLHANWTAFQAVVADLREAAPDVVLHGGDLADNGASPVEIIDEVRERGWRGVMGNTDEMLVRPESAQEFSAHSPQLKPIFDAVEEIAQATRERLGAERLEWLSRLPHTEALEAVDLVHASPASRWRAPAPEAPDEELQVVYGELRRGVAVYGHIHRPYIRTVGSLTVANAGSVGLTYDGDPRAAYLLIDEGVPQIRRVPYDVDRELEMLAHSGLPHWEWIAKILTNSAPVMP